MCAPHGWLAWHLNNCSVHDACLSPYEHPSPSKVYRLKINCLIEADDGELVESRFAMGEPQANRTAGSLWILGRVSKTNFLKRTT
jgi:hypothetical protein